MIDDSETQSYFEHIGEYVSKICELARVHVVRLDPGYFKIAMVLYIVVAVVVVVVVGFVGAGFHTSAISLIRSFI